MDYNTVSFPGLGIGEFKIDPTAFRISNNIRIQWYAIIICVAILTAFYVCDRLAKRFSIKSDDLFDLLLIGLPVCFVGARIWYVLGDLDSFHSFMEVIAVWNGGLAIYGGIFSAALVTFFFCKKRKLSVLNLLDLVSIGFLIGQAIGRWGNFANVEVFGVQTDLPWRMGVGVDCIAEYVHPLFFYESLWNVFGLLLIFIFLDFRKYRGEVFFFYTAWYGIGRAWMESLRDASFNLHIFGLRVNLVLAIIAAAFGVFGILFLHLRKPNALAIGSPKPASSDPEYIKQFTEAADKDNGGEKPAEPEETQNGNKD